LYETFSPEEANRIRNRLEIHYTPKHGSDFKTAAWNVWRNKDACKIDWRFTTADARIKLKRLYPQFSS
jgi:hypothetical protein